MDITFEQLNAFQAVAKTLSFSKAAKLVYRTQSAVSIQILRLEDVIGQKLFHRTTKSIELTDAGRVFLKYATQIDDILKEAETELIDLKKMDKGKLTLSTSDTTACYRLPRILQSYKEKYPGIEIIVRNATSLKTIESVLNNEVDLGISTFKYLSPELETIPLFPRDDVVISHPDHPLAKRKRTYLKDLEQYPFILLDRNCSSRRILDEVCKEAGVQLNVAMELSSIEVVKQFVKINSGISIVPMISVEKEMTEQNLAAVQISDLNKADPIRMGIIYKKTRYLSLAAESFLDMLTP